jgi:adenylate cyclase
VASDPSNPLTLYNIACLHSLAGRTSLALDHLELAVEKGMRNRDWFMTDPDLEPIRDDPRFHALLATNSGPA